MTFTVDTNWLMERELIDDCFTDKSKCVVELDDRQANKIAREMWGMTVDEYFETGYAPVDVEDILDEALDRRYPLYISTLTGYFYENNKEPEY